MKYAIRIPTNENLQRDIEELRWAGPARNRRSSTRAFCPKPRVGRRPDGWWPRWNIMSRSCPCAWRGVIVTNWTLPTRAVVRCYNKWGTVGQWTQEGQQAVKMTRLSCHKFRSNEVRLWLTLLTYNLGNLRLRLTLSHRIKTWSLTSLQQRLVKTGGRLLKPARYDWLLLAEGHWSRRLFSSKQLWLPSTVFG